MIGLLLGVVTAAMWLATCAAAQSAFTIADSVPRSAGALAYGFDGVWAISEGRLLRLDPVSGSVAEIPLPQSGTGLTLPELDGYRGIGIGEGAVWLPDLAASVIHKVDPTQLAVVQSLPTDIFGSGGSIGVGEGSIWVSIFADRNKTLVRYSADNGMEQARISLPEPAAGVLAAEGSVWVTAASHAKLYRIDPSTNRVVGTSELAGPTALIAAGYGAIWVSHTTQGLVQRIDPKTGTITATIGTGVHDMEPDGDLAVGGGFIWTINRSGIIARIDPSSNAAAGVFVPPSGTIVGRRLRYGGASLWVSGASIFRIDIPASE